MPISFLVVADPEADRGDVAVVERRLCERLAPVIEVVGRAADASTLWLLETTSLDFCAEARAVGQLVD